LTVLEAIQIIDSQVHDKRKGLPEELFQFISRTTPLVNVDLLIKDGSGNTLLAWRDDEHSGTGWHVPGGIVRFQETLADRLQKTALREIGTKVDFDRNPIQIEELIIPNKDIRGHHISFLYNCRLPVEFIVSNAGKTEKDEGFLKWHKECPTDLLEIHKMYKKYL
jgi:colanic acid biosynthesis protein WcaH